MELENALSKKNKKRKKKQKFLENFDTGHKGETAPDDIINTVDSDPGVNNSCSKTTSRRKKRKNDNSCREGDCSINVIDENTEDENISTSNSKSVIPKKKKKKKKVKNTNSEDFVSKNNVSFDEEIKEETTSNTEAHGKKKNKLKVISQDDSVTSDVLDAGCHIRKKSKKHKRKDNTNKVLVIQQKKSKQSYSEGGEESSVKTKKATERVAKEASVSDNGTDSFGERKTDKKCKSKKSDACTDNSSQKKKDEFNESKEMKNETPNNTDKISGMCSETHKRKTKKCKKKSKDDLVDPQKVLVDTDINCIEKKAKKHKEKIVEEDDDPPKKKMKHSIDDNYESSALLEKTNDGSKNDNSFNKIKERGSEKQKKKHKKQTLDKHKKPPHENQKKSESDFELDKEKSTVTKVENHCFQSGQWSTASFGDQQRQDKFLRLLGGFKNAKGNKPSSSPFGMTRGNIAMDKMQENTYMRNMEDHYGKAMSFNMNRGLGLGFEKPLSEGKKFYIDKNISNSKKFDD